MPAAPFPPNESQRLEALFRYNILDSDAETAYDDLVEIAAHIYKTPIALISLVDSDRQWFKAKVGLDAEQTHRDTAFCAHAILQDNVFVVPDASKDERFNDNPLVTGAPDIRFYAGAPLITSDGYTLGTLCVIDQQPHCLEKGHYKALEALSRQVISQLELRLYAMQLKDMNERKDRFFALLSHDLKNPFNVLLGFSKRLSNGATKLQPDKISTIANSLYNASTQAYDLLTNLLDWSRFQLGGMTYVPETVDLGERVHLVFGLLQDQATAKGIALNNCVGDDIVVYADPQMLRSVLFNLVGNGIKFSEKGGEVAVSCETCDGVIRISVSDKGCGLSAERQAQLFKLGNYSSTPGTAGEQGTGFGTVLCKEIINYHGGEIGVDSEPDQGSRFYFTLPQKM